MNQGWEVKPLKELCHNFKNDIVDGPFGSNLKRDDYVTSGIPVLKIQNIKPFQITLKKMDYVTKEKYQELKRHSYKKGDIVITKLGDPLGASAIVEDIDDGLIVADLVRVRAEKIDTEYLCYHLNSPNTTDFINAQQAGATRPRVKISAVRDLPINVPSLPEQKEIVALLDEAFAGIDKVVENTKRNLQNARDLFESHLQNIFTTKGDDWEEKTLKQAAKVFGRGKSKHRPRNDEKLYGGTYPFIQTGDVRNSNHYIQGYSKTYNEAGLAQSKLWPKGTICITIAANIAETGILDFEACFPDSVIGIVVDDNITGNTYVEYLLQSFKAHLQAQGKGSAQDNINLGTFENQTFPFPPLPEQKRIVAELDALSAQTKRLEAIYQQKLDDLAELKQSILQKAFAGELTNTQKVAA